MKDIYAIPGKRAVKLICVSVGGKTKSSNKFYRMYELGDGTFLARWGREGNEASSRIYPMSKWDSTIRSKIQRKDNPYTDVTHLFIEEGDSDTVDPFNSIPEISIRELMLSLNGFARNSIRKNYSISADSVTRIQINTAQSKIDKISYEISFGQIDVKKINDALIELYHLIPRKMNNVANYLCDPSSDDPATVFNRIVHNEQLTLDTLSGQISLTSKVKETSNESILDKLGLTLEVASNEDVKMIKGMMQDSAAYFSRAYKVTNSKTQLAFDNNLKSASNKTTKLLWHGSRNENWFNIISEGLMIRPAGAVHTGSMFGDAVYGADLARKSIGYTSIEGSYWSRGSSKTAYLALYEFHVGKMHVIKKHTSDCYSLNKAKLNAMNADSVFALKGVDLKNNEYMVYDKSQCTIAYLIEIKKPD